MAHQFVRQHCGMVLLVDILNSGFVARSQLRNDTKARWNVAHQFSRQHNGMVWQVTKLNCGSIDYSSS